MPALHLLLAELKKEWRKWILRDSWWNWILLDSWMNQIVLRTPTRIFRKYLIKAKPSVHCAAVISAFLQFSVEIQYMVPYQAWKFVF
jgi:hypothetical protein